MADREINKRRAMQLLDCGKTTLQVFMSEGRLDSHTVQGKRGPEKWFWERDVLKLKRELDEEKKAQSAALQLGVARALITPGEARQQRKAREQGEQFYQMSAMAAAQTIQSLMQSKALPSANGHGVPLADRASLSISEAVELSGCSESYLRIGMDKKKIRYDYNGPHGALRLSKDDVMAFASSWPKIKR